MNEETYYSEPVEPEEERRNPWLKVLLGILVLVIIVLIAFIFLRACGKKDSTNDRDRYLLEAGKEHYNQQKVDLPEATGECKTISLGQLLEEDLITKPKIYEACDKTETKVKVCKLASGKYQYVPILACDGKKSDDYFGEWNIGSENDLTPDKSDVMFYFMGEQAKTDDSNVGSEEEYWLDEVPYENYKTISSTKYYRYRDQQWQWIMNTKQYYPGDKLNPNDVSQYYINSPASGYTNRDNGNSDAAKWYLENKSFWNNGAYSASQPSGFETKGESKQECTWTSTGAPVVTNPTIKGYVCGKPGSTVTINSPYACGSIPGDDFTIEISKIYTCNGTDTVAAGAVCSRTCPNGGTYNADKGSCGNDSCSTVYQWYHTERSYYPSKATTADGENTYFVNAPIAGAIKDNGTITTAFKYYKLVQGATSGYSATAPTNGAVKTGNPIWGNWTEFGTNQPANNINGVGTREIETKTKVKIQKITDDNLQWGVVTEGYITETELIAKFQELGYPVYTLADIEANGEIRYSVQLRYRDRK